VDLLRVRQTEPRAFCLSGELDLSCLGDLDAVEKAAREGGDLRLDLARLTFVDGAGLDRLAAIARALGESSGRLIALRPQRSTERLLKRVASVERLDNLIITRLTRVVEDSFEPPSLPRELGQVIVSDYTPEAACRLVAELAVASIPGAESAYLTVRNAGHPTCAASTDHTSETVGTFEVELGAGPSLDSMRLTERQSSPSLVTERRWPEFTNQALYSGVASVLAQPLTAHESVFGALTVCSTHESAFKESSFTEAAGLALQAAVVIANSNLYWQATELSDQLREALESRAVIDQAKGILMARDGVSPDEAFAILLKTSQTGNMKVRDIALQLVAGAQERAPRKAVG
jgi:GAF domain-containing protein